jgi:FtsZ-interacting cell division protein ZipA
MIWVIVAVVVVLLVVAALLVARQQRSRQLKKGFGPEYDRVLAERDDQKAAERELLERQKRRRQFEIRSLEPASRERYVQQWEATQRLFVDDPAAAVDQADVLVQQVMHDRGYPVEDDFEQRAADISVDHPVVVEHYRAARSISVDSRDGQANTEQMRQSLVHFRALFDELLAPQDAGHAREGKDRELSHQTTSRSG